MQVRWRRCEAVEVEYDTVRRAADVCGVMIAFLGREVQRCCFIGEKSADETLSVLHDPSAAFVTADDEARRYGGWHEGRIAY
jgi:hypothetical protein